MATSKRSYNISDDGDGFSLSLFEDGYQIASCLFPLGPAGVDHAYGLAFALGEFFVYQTTKTPLQGSLKGAYDHVLIVVRC